MADAPAQKSWLARRAGSITLLKQLGPGLITGAADDDPSGIATYSQAGAQAGFGLLWTMVLTFPLMVAIQLVSAHIGRITGQGLARNMLKVMPRWLGTALIALLFIANTINAGADIAAMGEASELLAGFGAHWFALGFAALSVVLQMFVPYRRYARFLIVLTLSLLAYVAVVLMVKIDWTEACLAMIGIGVTLSPAAATIIVAVFGTTISPYLFFWQAAQEVEEIEQHPGERPLVDDPPEAPQAFARIEFDTVVGMFASNVISLAIMIATAATLHAHGKTDIQTAADAARALEPIAGRFAFAFFTLGIVGTGLLAIPVLVGSCAYAVSELRDWKEGLDYKPWEARGFYAVIVVAVALGVVMDWTNIDPIQALFWSAVVNGVIAVPMMFAMMFVVSNRKLMGEFTAGPVLKGFGWLSTFVMLAASVAMVVTSF
ncbi:MAG: divalent metal cation transporter [Alphaproteobacteria bacterium]|nr:divalent metal cation transporter [Alphaproteobacteria bacterium]MBL6939754.1 divalent metal cation transporter [Alphaproteobacteria bacterium]MBL7096924.1 divalent metal cation transporter [Alphaproteobacteria bacterium]